MYNQGFHPDTIEKQYKIMKKRIVFYCQIYKILGYVLSNVIKFKSIYMNKLANLILIKFYYTCILLYLYNITLYHFNRTILFARSLLFRESGIYFFLVIHIACERKYKEKFRF